MIDKIMIFGWIAISAILIVENMITWSYAFVGIAASKTWILSLVSIIIWIFMWYGIRWIVSGNDNSNDNDDLYDF